MHARLPVLAAAVLVGAAFAGCVGAPEPVADPGPEPLDRGDGGAATTTPSGPDDAPPAPAPTVAAYPYSGKLTAAAGAPDVGYLSPTGGQDPHVFAFQVGSGAQGLVVELRWADRMHDLDLEVAAPGCDGNTGVGPCLFADGGSPGSGDSPVRFEVTDPEMLAMSGDWRLMVWAKNAVNADFDGVISIFYNAPPAPGYTALS